MVSKPHLINDNLIILTITLAYKVLTIIGKFLCYLLYLLSYTLVLC